MTFLIEQGKRAHYLRGRVRPSLFWSFPKVVVTLTMGDQRPANTGQRKTDLPVAEASWQGLEW